MSTAFPSWRCPDAVSLCTRGKLKLCLHDTRDCAKPFGSAGLVILCEILSKSGSRAKISLGLGQFLLIFSLSQSDFVSFLSEDIADKGNIGLSKMGKILVITIVDSKSFENMSCGGYVNTSKLPRVSVQSHELLCGFPDCSLAGLILSCAN